MVSTKEENVAIYRVSKGIDTIFHGEISVWRYFEINIEKSVISRDISEILAINRRFFLIYRMINAGQRKSNTLQCSQCATVLLQCASHLLSRGFEPTYHLG